MHQADINRLNVYPVPDGDTGTNMALTLEAVVTELEGVEAGAGLPAVCKAIGHGSLMGARGNSGVILSQLLRGMSERMAARRGRRRRAPTSWWTPSRHAADLARRAVVRPVEGTILTVASAAAQPGRRSGTGLVGVVEAPAARRPTPWPARPRCCPSWPRPAWWTPAAPATCSCSMRSSSCSTAGPCPSPRGSTPRTSAPSTGRRGRPPMARAASEHAVGDLRYEVMYFLERARRLDRGLQGGVGRHRRLHRGGGGRRPVELPHPHRRHRRGHRGRRGRRAARSASG